MTDDERKKAREQAEFDQASASFGDNFPTLWRRTYLGCVKEGFTPFESMDLLKTMILGMSRPNS